MSDYLLTDRDGIDIIRRKINGLRADIGYDVINSPHNTEFEELEVLLSDATAKLDDISDKLKDHVYAYDVTVTVTKRVYVLSADECDAEQAAMDYAVSELDCPIDWTEDDVAIERHEDEETTTVYDVEV
jgi:hypothetical protein